MSTGWYGGLLYGSSLLSVIGVLVIQFLISASVDDKCDPDVELYFNPPILAGSALLGSVLLSLLWAWTARKSKEGNTGWDPLRRIFIFLWTASVTIGVAAIGVSLGQILAVDKYVVGQQATATDPDPTCLLKTDANLKVLQYVSLALVTFSLVAPHAFSIKASTKSGNKDNDAGAGAPLLGENNGVNSKPLVFL